VLPAERRGRRECAEKTSAHGISPPHPARAISTKIQRGGPSSTVCDEYCTPRPRKVQYSSQWGLVPSTRLGSRHLVRTSLQRVQQLLDPPRSFGRVRERAASVHMIGAPANAVRVRRRGPLPPRATPPPPSAAGAACPVRVAARGAVEDKMSPPSR